MSGHSKSNTGDNSKKRNSGETSKNSSFKRKKFPIFETLTTVALFIVLVVQPDKGVLVLRKTLSLFLKILPVYASVCLLSSFLSQFVSKETIKKYLGKEAGIKGILIAVALGTLIAGPMWVMFPLFATLLEMGASVGVVSALIATFYIKTPWIPYAATFLGWKFMGYFCTLILIYAIVFSISMEAISSWLFPDSSKKSKS